MSTRHNNGPEYENHQRAAELHDLAAQAHRSAADAREKEEHQTGHERSRRSLEHSREANEHSEWAPSNAQHGIATFGHQDTAVLAYALWQARGCPGRIGGRRLVPCRARPAKTRGKSPRVKPRVE